MIYKDQDSIFIEGEKFLITQTNALTINIQHIGTELQFVCTKKELDGCMRLSEHRTKEEQEFTDGIKDTIRGLRTIDEQIASMQGDAPKMIPELLKIKREDFLVAERTEGDKHMTIFFSRDSQFNGPQKCFNFELI